MNINNSSKIVINLTPMFLLVFVIFFMLKVTGTVSWSWLLVTAPLWAPWTIFIMIYAVFVAFILGVLLIAAITGGFGK